MKKLILGMSFFALISCGPGALLGSKVSSSSSKSSNLGIKINPIKIKPVKLSLSRTDLYEGDYTTNKTSKLNVFSCISKALTIDLVTSILDGVIENITKREYDLVIPEALSQKIFDDLRDKSREEKIDVASFWTRLDGKIAKELNEFLVYEHLKKTDSKFNNLKRRVAMGLTLLVESGDFDKGIKLQLKNKNGDKRFSLAFSEDASGKIETPLCDSYEVDSIDLNENDLKPSDITTYITCEKDNQSLLIEGKFGTELTLSINDGDIEESVIMKTDELVVTKATDRKSIYEHSSDEVSSLKLFMVKRDLINKSLRGTLKIKSDVLNTKMRRMNCEVVKEL
jgi:hypothetical protein